VLDLSRFGPEQRRAVLAPDGPLLIVAGPGSGKTTVLAARIAYLIVSRQIPPTSILALTFATKAARELKSRLSGLLGEVGLAVDAMTFHAFGLRVARQWSEELGFGLTPPTVYGDHDARALLLEALTRADIPSHTKPFAEWVSSVTHLRLATDGTPADETTHAVIREYEALLRRRGAIDYPAMLALPLRLFSERPLALRLYQDAYRYVLVDEFQDVCGAQYELLRLLAERHRNLIAVGDPRQALYGWRGADVRFLDRLQRDFPGTQLLSLDQNFRSTGQIVRLANALAEPLGSYPPLWTDNPPGIRAVFFTATNEQQEAAFVAAEISRLESDRMTGSLREIAVLYRTNRQASELIFALRERRLPYRVRGGADLLARREVRDLIAYLRLAHNPEDEAALTRIVNVPPRRLGRLAEALRAQPCTTSQLVDRARRVGPVAIGDASALVDLIRRLHDQVRHQSPAETLDLVLDRTGYRTWVSGKSSGTSDLRWLSDLRRLAERSDGALGDWLAELQLGEESVPDADDAGSVLLTTIHGAKGGEWAVVFVVGVEEGLLPHVRSSVSTTSTANGTRVLIGSGVDEELRVAYVAVTRPRERLYLTCCRNRVVGDRVEGRMPSRFLRGIPADLLAPAA
jgi:DNA helicase II / ATP-dependent DNA helicase PcrA